MQMQRLNILTFCQESDKTGNLVTKFRSEMKNG